MFDTNFSTRHNLVKTNHELSNGFNSNNYKKGQINKADIDAKFENLSIQNEVLMSSILARKKVLESSVYTSRDTVVDVPLLVQEEDNANFVSENSYYNLENKGKDIIALMKQQEENKDKNFFI